MSLTEPVSSTAPISTELAEPIREVDLLNFRWLMALRWVAVVGQTLAIVVVWVFLGIPLPLLPMALVLAAEVLLNVGAYRMSRTRALLTELETAIWVTADLVAFTVLLFLSGGPSNPFSFFYILHVAMAALTLSPPYTWGLVLVSAACYTSMFVWHVPLGPVTGQLSREELFLYGAWVAYALGASCIAYFLHRARAALKQREELLSEQRELRIQAERLSSLATLAAGAAHELANPLSTIAVVSKELEHELPLLLGDSESGATAVADVALMRSQVERCRKILARMAHTAGEAPGESESWVTVSGLLSETLAELPQTERIERTVSDDLRGAELYCPKEALAQAIRVLVHNALDASTASVTVSAKRSESALVIEVTDRGKGMDPGVLKRAFEPFFTTKPAGKGMGLGLFLARNVASRLGGKLTLESRSDQGTTAVLHLPSSRIRPS